MSKKQQEDLDYRVMRNYEEEKIISVLDKLVDSTLEKAKDMHQSRETVTKAARKPILASSTVAAMGAAALLPKEMTSGGANAHKGIAGLSILAHLAGAAFIWGNARLAHEAAHQLINRDNANISSNLTKSMKSLKEFEDAHLKSNINALNVLKTLEKEILEEGNKWDPDLNNMRKNLTKSQLLRQSILRSSNLSNEKKQEIVNKSNAVAESFEEWAKVQQGRSTPIYNFINNSSTSDKAYIPRIPHNSSHTR